MLCEKKYYGLFSKHISMLYNTESMQPAQLRQLSSELQTWSPQVRACFKPIRFFFNFSKCIFLQIFFNGNKVRPHAVAHLKFQAYRTKTVASIPHLKNVLKFTGYFSCISTLSAQTADSKILYFQPNLTFTSRLLGHLKLI